MKTDEETGLPCYVANGDSGRVIEIGKASVTVRIGKKVFYLKKTDLVDWDLFYAGTVHRGQGSQWPCVITIADDYPGANFVCDRSWHYTAYSRASKLSIVLGKRSTIDRHCQKVGMGRTENLPDGANPAMVSAANSRLNDIAYCPFEIVVDSNEGAPFSFLGMKTPEAEGKKPLVVRIVRKALWNTAVRTVITKRGTFNIGLADYSIEGMEGLVQIERKSIADLFGTLGGRREKFEAEIKRLHEDCQFAAVVVEGGWDQVILWRGNGPSPQSVVGTIIAWMQRYRNVHWLLLPSRSAAERVTFRLLERFWNDAQNHKR
jgi:hypothetical protein